MSKTEEIDQELRKASNERAFNAVTQMLEEPDASGMEEESIILNPDLSTLDRETQEKVMYALASQQDSVTQVDTESVIGNKPTKVVYERNGEKLWVEFDVGTSEIEKVTAPHSDIREGFEDLNFLDERIYEAIRDADLEGVAMYQMGHAPSLMSKEFGEKLAEQSGEKYLRGPLMEGVPRESMKDMIVDKPRYPPHQGFYLDENENVVIGPIYGTASLQVSSHAQIAPYFEDVSEEELRKVAETGFVTPAVEESFDNYIRDINGGGEYASMHRLADILFHDDHFSPYVDEDEDREPVLTEKAARKLYYDQFQKAKSNDGLRAFDMPEFDDVKSNHDLTMMKAQERAMEFGPKAQVRDLDVPESGLPLHVHMQMEYEGVNNPSEIEADEDEYVVRPDRVVPTTLSNKEGEMKTLTELLEDRVANGVATFEYDGEEANREVRFDIDQIAERADVEEDLWKELGLLELHNSGMWETFRMRDSAGASFESRLPPTSPRRQDMAYEQKAVLNSTYDLQNWFKDRGIDSNSMTHDVWKDIRGQTPESDYVLPFDIDVGDQTYDDVTVQELKYGSERMDGFIEVLEEGLARTVGEEEAAEWRYRKENEAEVVEEFYDDVKDYGLEEAVRNTRIESDYEKMPEAAE